MGKNGDTSPSVRSVIAQGARLVELYSRPPGPQPADVDGLVQMSWLAAVRSLEATNVTMKVLQEDILLVLIAAYKMGRLAGIRYFAPEAPDTEAQE